MSELEEILIVEELRKKRSAAGRKGGRSLFEKRGKKHMSNLGRRGGKRLVARRGKAYMSKIGREGYIKMMRNIAAAGGTDGEASNTS